MRKRKRGYFASYFFSSLRNQWNAKYGGKEHLIGEFERQKFPIFRCVVFSNLAILMIYYFGINMKTCGLNYYKGTKSVFNRIIEYLRPTFHFICMILNLKTKHF